MLEFGSERRGVGIQQRSETLAVTTCGYTETGCPHKLWTFDLSLEF